jgi:hypothetical protein
MLLHLLATMPTHIREIIPDFPTLTGTHDASGKGMGIFFAGPNGTPYLWRHQWSPSKAACLVTFGNPHGNILINAFELAGHMAQLWLAVPKMEPLEAMLNSCDNLTSICG